MVSSQHPSLQNQLGNILLVLGVVTAAAAALATSTAAAPPPQPTTSNASTESEITPTKLGYEVLDTQVGAKSSDGDGKTADDAADSELEVSPTITISANKGDKV